MAIAGPSNPLASMRPPVIVMFDTAAVPFWRITAPVYLDACATGTDADQPRLITALRVNLKWVFDGTSSGAVRVQVPSTTTSAPPAVSAASSAACRVE